MDRPRLRRVASKGGEMGTGPSRREHRHQGCLRRAVVLALIGSVSTGAAATDLTFTESSTSAGVIAQHSPSVQFLSSPYNISNFTSGGAVGDFNNDGFQDLFVLTTGGYSGDSPDKLFVNNGNGTFTEQGAAWGLAGTPHMGIGAAVGDYDADGWLDIYVTSFGATTQSPRPNRHRLYRNTGAGAFIEVAQIAGVRETSTSIPDGFGAAFGDYDLDGDLDLYVAGWLLFSNGSTLFRNNGNASFTAVTSQAGLADPALRGYSPCFVDMNGDRYPELLLAGDFGTSRYYRNNADGTFTDLTVASGTGLDDNGMGQAVADFDGDGRLDWYVTSIFSLGTGMSNVPGTGNMLYWGIGAHAFTEGSVPAGVNDGGWGWGAVAVDWNHDGRVDIAETNGWAGSNGYFEYEWQGEQNYLWQNNGDGTFTEIAQTAGVADELQGRGLLNVDYDNDGDQDMVVFAMNGPVRLYRNDLSGPQANWLRVFLKTRSEPALAPNGIGSKVSVNVAGEIQIRSINGGCNYLSQSELSAHFGLETADKADEVRVEWSDGRVTVLNHVTANRTLTICPASLPGDTNCDGQIDGLDISKFILALVAREQYEIDMPSCIAENANLNNDAQIDLDDGSILIDMLLTAVARADAPDNARLAE